MHLGGDKMQNTVATPKPETMTALCARTYEVTNTVTNMGNTPTNCAGQNGYVVDDHR